MTSASFLSTSKTLHVLSRLALASRLPSGLNATAKIQSAWSSTWKRSLPVSTSKTRMARSAPAVASRLLSGLNATENTTSWVSTRSRTGFAPGPGSADQSRATPKMPGSPLAVAIHLPSGL